MASHTPSSAEDDHSSAYRTLSLRTLRSSRGVRLVLAGELDADTSRWFLDRADSSLGDNVGDVELDLSGLTFLDVAGARSTLTVQDRVQAAGGRLVVRDLDGRLPVVRVLGLDRYLWVRTSREDVEG